SAECRAELANLLRERISLRGICRAVGVSLTWLLHFMVECFASCPAHFHVQLPAHPAKVLLYNVELGAEEGQQTLDLASDGRHHTSDYCVSRGRSEPRECQSLVGRDPRGLSRARYISHGPI